MTASKTVMCLVILASLGLGALSAEVWPMTPRSRPIWLAIGVGSLVVVWTTVIFTRWRSRD